MTDLYAEDYLEKHPLDPAPWDLDGCDCPLCGETRCESERVCAQCRSEGAALARVVMPALNELMRLRQVASLCRAFDRDTVPAPDGSAEMAVAPTSIRTVYDLIRSPGGLAMLVVS